MEWCRREALEGLESVKGKNVGSGYAPILYVPYIITPKKN